MKVLNEIPTEENTQFVIIYIYNKLIWSNTIKLEDGKYFKYENGEELPPWRQIEINELGHFYSNKGTILILADSETKEVKNLEKELGDRFA